MDINKPIVSPERLRSMAARAALENDTQTMELLREIERLEELTEALEPAPAEATP